MLFLATLAFTFQSCDKDDDGGSSSINFDNEVVIDGTTYQLNGTGILESFGSEDNGVFDWDVYLNSEDFNTEVYLDLNTNSENGLVEGTYSFSEDRQEFTYVYASIDYIDGDGDASFYSFEDGTVTIDIDGDTVGISFSFTSSDDTVVAGEWSGELTSFQD